MRSIGQTIIEYPITSDWCDRYSRTRTEVGSRRSWYVMTTTSWTWRGEKTWTWRTCGHHCRGPHHQVLYRLPQTTWTPTRIVNSLLVYSGQLKVVSIVNWSGHLGL